MGKLNKKYIGLDLDGTIADYRSGVENYIKQNFDNSFNMELLDSKKIFDINQYIKELHQEIDDETIHSLFETLPVFNYHNIFLEAFELCSSLGKELIVITSRPIEECPNIKDYTYSWLNQNNVPFKKIHFKKEKANLIKSVYNDDFACFFEDELKQANSISERGVDVILFDRFYNQGETNKNVKRIKDEDLSKEISFIVS